MYRMVLKRSQEDDKQTLGYFVILNASQVPIFSGVTLELPWKNNFRQISRIPSGSYAVLPRYSDKHKKHYEIWGVHDRDKILIHSGNFHKQTLGCVLIGSGFADIDADGYMDVVESRKTLNKIINLMGDDGFTIGVS